MKPWINYQHLLYFKTIATEGSIALAADRLRLGPPTLSAQLKQFEETIGVKLFERQHKNLTLTEAGRVALQYANDIFRTGDEMLELLHDRLAPMRTHVQIASLDSIPKQLTLAVAKAPMILPTVHSILRHDLEHFLKTAAISIDIVAETQDTSLQKLMGIDGIGIIPIPIFAVGRSDQVRWFDLAGPAAGDFRRILPSVILG